MPILQRGWNVIPEYGQSTQLIRAFWKEGAHDSILPWKQALHVDASGTPFMTHLHTTCPQVASSFPILVAASNLGTGTFSPKGTCPQFTIQRKAGESITSLVSSLEYGAVCQTSALDDEKLS